jgi:hypothetical protein
VSFDELLAVLLGLVGRRLSVAIATAGEPPIMVGSMAGMLRAGTELDAAGQEAAVFFVLEDGETGSSSRASSSRARRSIASTRRRSSSGSAR